MNSLSAQAVQTVSADFFSGTANMNKVFDEDMNGLSILNKHTEDMTFTIDDVTRPVLAKGTYTQVFKKPVSRINGCGYRSILHRCAAAAGRFNSCCRSSTG